MLRVTLRNLGAHKRRLVSTFAAVLLGVAFLSGVLVQTATLEHGFDRLFDTESASVDAVVRSERTLTDSMDDTLRPRIDASLVDRVRALPGVRDAVGDVRATAVIVGKDGDQLGTMGPPRLGLTWIDDPALSPYRLATGRAPTGPDEVVLDVASARSGHLAVGDRATILTPDPVAVTVVGTARFGDQDAQAGITAALFSPEGARAHLAGGAAQVDRIVIAAEPGTDRAALTAEVRRALRGEAGLQVISGDRFRAENRASVDSLLAFLRPMLIAFALIALLVAAFSIANTFAIIVAQRTREAGLLRALGASRRQTLRAVLVEATVVGLAGSVAGAAAGIGLAALFGRVFASTGMGASAGLVVVPGALAACVAVGTALTVLCALGPAVWASRVPPIAALREAALDRSGAGRVRAALGAVLAAGGIGLALLGTARNAIGAAAGGVALAVIGVAVLGPVLARPVGRILGTPLRLRGVTGDLARTNAVRNPRRTASTSRALMIGVAIVALFTAIGASLRAGVDHLVDTGFGGDLVATDGTSGAGFDPSVATRIAALPQVAAAAGLGDAPARIDGEETILGVSDPSQVGRVLHVDVQEGSFEAVTGPSLAVSRSKATAEGWHLGSPVPYELLDGTSGDLVVRAIFADTDLAGDVLGDTSFFLGHGAPVTDSAVVIDLAPGVSLDAGRAAVRAAVADVPTIDVQDKDEFAASLGSQVNSILAVVYGLLALSILIALIGIANTLSLSTHERTRELGLLRAVGQVRSQTRAMVRWESVVIAVFGTTLGLAAGIGGAWAIVGSSTEDVLSVLSIPAGPVLTILGLGALAGVLAAVRPAIRAARLDPLTAIATS